MHYYTRMTVMYSIPTSQISNVTGTLQHVHFNNFIDTHFINLLLGIITKLSTFFFLIVKERLLPQFFPFVSL